jgi:hypothetical protein
VTSQKFLVVSFITRPLKTTNMRTKKFSFLILLFALAGVVSAQENKKAKKIASNFLKTNLTSIPLKNYSLQYERVVRKKMSLAISFRAMPTTSIPFKAMVLDAVGNDPDTKATIEKFRLSNFAITPEVRFYLGKGRGKGFYIAPFYRYSSFRTNDLIFTYSDGLGGTGEIALSGKLTSHTGGLLFGAQYMLGRHFCLDWWILGPHIGAGRGTFTGTSSEPLTPTEQNDIRQQLENIDIPLTHKTVTVNTNGASLKLDGPWGGIRAGLSFGVRL